MKKPFFNLFCINIIFILIIYFIFENKSIAKKIEAKKSMTSEMEGSGLNFSGGAGLVGVQPNNGGGFLLAPLNTTVNVGLN